SGPAKRATPAMRAAAPATVKTAKTILAARRLPAMNRLSTDPWIGRTVGRSRGHNEGPSPLALARSAGSFETFWLVTHDLAPLRDCPFVPCCLRRPPHLTRQGAAKTTVRKGIALSGLDAPTS